MYWKVGVESTVSRRHEFKDQAWKAGSPSEKTSQATIPSLNQINDNLMLTVKSEDSALRLPGLESWPSTSYMTLGKSNNRSMSQENENNSIYLVGLFSRLIELIYVEPLQQCLAGGQFQFIIGVIIVITIYAWFYIYIYMTYIYIYALYIPLPVTLLLLLLLLFFPSRRLQIMTLST